MTERERERVVHLRFFDFFVGGGLLHFQHFVEVRHCLSKREVFTSRVVTLNEQDRSGGKREISLYLFPCSQQSDQSEENEGQTGDKQHVQQGYRREENILSLSLSLSLVSVIFFR